MIKRFIYSCLLILSLQSCAGYKEVIDRSGFELTIAAVGDSITYGFGIDDRLQNSYPSQLGYLLGYTFLVENFGRNGATVLQRGNRPYVASGAYAEALRYQPDVVIISLGTNDSKRQNRIYLDDFIMDYIELINSFKDLESRPRIFICYPPPAYGGLWSIDDSIIRERIIPSIDSVAEKTGARIIDLYSPLENSSALFPDKIHPDAEGAAIIAETVYQVIQENL